MVVFISCTVFLITQNKTPKPIATTTSNSSNSDIVIDEPNPDTSNTCSDEELNADVGKNEDNKEQIITPQGKKFDEKAEQAKPIIPQNSKQTENSVEIPIGDGGVKEKYSCGSPNHHCQNSENHAYISNLENNGCTMCGSHSCASFYGISAAGIPICKRNLCPKYNDKKDPIKYCQRCSREMWSKDNPTGCFSFLKPTDCECGEHVKGNTCHHH